jgi:UDP-glucuronate 4-epimerase
MAYSYASLYGIASTGLRFFTVYGPWGRPDMALFTFTRAILAGQPIEVFNNGQHKRDFTYVEDIVEGVLRVLDRPARADGAWDARAADPATGQVPHRLYNIGSHRPILLLRFIEVLEGCLGMQAEKIFRPIQPGDVPDTLADVTELVNGFGYRPDTPIEVGVARFVEWYREFYAVQEVQHG